MSSKRGDKTGNRDHAMFNRKQPALQPQILRRPPQTPPSSDPFPPLGGSSNPSIPDANSLGMQPMNPMAGFPVNGHPMMGPPSLFSMPMVPPHQHQPMQQRMPTANFGGAFGNQQSPFGGYRPPPVNAGRGGRAAGSAFAPRGAFSQRTFGRAAPNKPDHWEKTWPDLGVIQLMFGLRTGRRLSAIIDLNHSTHPLRERAAEELERQFHNEWPYQTNPPVSLASVPFLRDHSIRALTTPSASFSWAVYYCTLCEHHCKDIDHVIEHLPSHYKEEMRQQNRQDLPNRLPEVTESHLAALDIAIDHHLQSIRAPQRRAALSNVVEEVIDSLGDHCLELSSSDREARVNVIGSFDAGCVHNDSDLNINVSVDGEKPQFFVSSLFDKLREPSSGWEDVRLSESPTFSCCIEASFKGIPITVDWQNDDAVKMTTLLEIYNALQPGLEEFRMFIHDWARRLDLVSPTKLAAQHAIPLYQLDIMIIYALQQTKRLPSVHEARARTGVDLLQKNIDDIKNDPQTASLLSQLKWRMAEVALEFFFFYVSTDLKHDIVQITTTVKQTKEDTKYNKKHLVVLDPFRDRQVSTVHKAFQCFFHNCFLTSYVNLRVPTAREKGRLVSVQMYQLANASPSKVRRMGSTSTRPSEADETAAVTEADSMTANTEEEGEEAPSTNDSFDHPPYYEDDEVFDNKENEMPEMNKENDNQGNGMPSTVVSSSTTLIGQGDIEGGARPSQSFLDSIFSNAIDKSERIAGPTSSDHLQVAVLRVPTNDSVRIIYANLQDLLLDYDIIVMMEDIGGAIGPTATTFPYGRGEEARMAHKLTYSTPLATYTFLFRFPLEGPYEWHHYPQRWRGPEQGVMLYLDCFPRGDLGLVRLGIAIAGTRQASNKENFNRFMDNLETVVMADNRRTFFVASFDITSAFFTDHYKPDERAKRLKSMMYDHRSLRVWSVDKDLFALGRECGVGKKRKMAQFNFPDGCIKFRLSWKASEKGCTLSLSAADIKAVEQSRGITGLATEREEEAGDAGYTVHEEENEEDKDLRIHGKPLEEMQADDWILRDNGAISPNTIRGIPPAEELPFDTKEILRDECISTEIEPLIDIFGEEPESSHIHQILASEPTDWCIEYVEVDDAPNCIYSRKTVKGLSGEATMWDDEVSDSTKSVKGLSGEATRWDDETWLRADAARVPLRDERREEREMEREEKEVERLRTEASESATTIDVTVVTVKKKNKKKKKKALTATPWEVEEQPTEEAPVLEEANPTADSPHSIEADAQLAAALQEEEDQLTIELIGPTPTTSATDVTGPEIPNGLPAADRDDGCSNPSTSQTQNDEELLNVPSKAVYNVVDKAAIIKHDRKLALAAILGEDSDEKEEEKEEEAPIAAPRPKIPDPLPPLPPKTVDRDEERRAKRQERLKKEREEQGAVNRPPYVVPPPLSAVDGDPTTFLPTYEELYVEVADYDIAQMDSELAALEVNDFDFNLTDLQKLTAGFRLEMHCTSCDSTKHLADHCPQLELPMVCVVDRTAWAEHYVDDVSLAISRIYCHESIAASRKNVIEQTLKDLQKVLDMEFGHGNFVLEVFGSSSNGFGTYKSDMDICFRYTPKYQSTLTTNHRSEMVEQETIRKIERALRKSHSFCDILSITSAKVPIVKFAHKNLKGVEGDISYYNELALHNTRLLRKYCDWTKDDILSKLGIWVKTWAKALDIGDASKGSLSSYAYILLLIHFLQRTSPPVLPVLQELGDLKENIVDRWNTYYHVGPPDLEWTKNTKTVGELFLDFLDYYSRFDFIREVIQIRQERPLMKVEKGWRKQICIEDPFDLDHNLGSGVSPRMFAFIMKSFRQSHQMFLTPGPRSDFCTKFILAQDTPIPEGSIQDFVKFMLKKCVVPGGCPKDRRCFRCSRLGHFADVCPNMGNSHRDGGGGGGRGGARGGKGKEDGSDTARRTPNATPNLTPKKTIDDGKKSSPGTPRNNEGMKQKKNKKKDTPEHEKSKKEAIDPINGANTAPVKSQRESAV